MVRQVQVFVPPEHSEQILGVLRDAQHAVSVACFHSDGADMIVFKSAEKHLGAIMDLLVAEGVGVRFGCIDIVALQSTTPALNVYRGSQRRGRRYRMDDRMTIDEIYGSIDEQSHLTFDYIAHTFAGSLIAAAGLLSDSSVSVVASMLVSPLMGPILAITFGFVIRDKHMLWRGLRNEAWGVLITTGVGVLVGLVRAAGARVGGVVADACCSRAQCCGPFYGPGGFDSSWSNVPLSSHEIDSRGNALALVSGAGVAVPSGIAVALAITGGGINVLVGARACACACVEEGTGGWPGGGGVPTHGCVRRWAWPSPPRCCRRW